jgi:hypothetical protein
MVVATIDYGLESDLILVCVLDVGGEIWCIPSQQARFHKNWTVGRVEVERIDLNAREKTDGRPAR